ncbi:MAG: hypothetical protein JWR39_30 [Devosia sp.]|jgi:O-antigen/teichoic acid export membrane protein|nr:hypothetical protein [Devosia sp.]
MSLARRLASQSTIIFGARLFGAGLVFVVQALIARLWGAALLGEYLLIVAAVNLISVAMPLGFQTVGAYFAAEYRARAQRRQLLVFMVWAYGHVLGTLALLLVAGYPLLTAIGQSESVLAQHLVPAVLLAFATAMFYVNGALLVGLKHPLAGYVVDSVFRPLIVMGGFLVTTSLAPPAQAFSDMLWLIGVGCALVSLVHFAYVVRIFRAVDDVAPPQSRELGRWWRFAVPWVLIGLATDFFFDIDLLLLSHLLEREELAIFGVCTRIFALASFGVGAVYAVNLPEIFESQANADRHTFLRKVGEANAVASGLSVLLFVVMAVGAPFGLLLFGPSFTAGALPLAVLCLSLVVRSVTGPASLVLSIHDRPYASLPALGLGMLTLVAGNALLVPPFGLMGASLAALVAITAWSAGLWVTAFKLAGLDVSILQWFRARRAAQLAAG